MGRQTNLVRELTAGGTRILTPRHFPLSESSEGVVGWTPDSKAIFFDSNRSGRFGIYKQSLDQDIAEPIVTEGYGRNPRVTPDGKNIVYLGIGENGPPPTRGPEPVTINCLPASVGSPITHRSERDLAQDIRLNGRAVNNRCDGPPVMETRITALDLFKGRGPELFRFPLVANNENWWLDLSPDGTRVAVTRTLAGPIYVLSLGGQVLKQIQVNGWSNLQGFFWSADGKSLFVTAGIRNGRELLHVDLQGNAHALWEDTGGSGETLALPSPDGRHLAFNGWTTNGNVWMMENF